jgi:hypothetical protein
MTIRVILASETHAGEVEFADKLQKVLKALTEDLLTVKIINAEQIFENFMCDGFGSPASPTDRHAANAYLKLREMFPFKAIYSPVRVSVVRQLREAGSVALVIIVGVHDSSVIDAIDAVPKDGNTYWYYLNASTQVRREQFVKRFPGIAISDVDSYLSMSEDDHHPSRSGCTKVPIDTKAGVTTSVLEIASEILLNFPPKGVNDAPPLRDDIGESVI